MFSQVNTEKEGEMNCKKDHAEYSTPKYSTTKYVLATLTLVVTMCGGLKFGYAIGEIPAGLGVHLEHFDRDKKGAALVQWMHALHGVPLCSKSTFTIVSTAIQDAPNFLK